VIGEVGQGVVDLATQQVLAIIQLRETHVLRVPALVSA